MNLLLDTHILLWALDEPSRLKPDMRALLEDSGNEVFFSAASIWEIAVKARLGRVDFPVGPEDIIRAARDVGFTELPVRADAAARVATLPLHHHDPFDRLLVAQALDEPMRLYTADTLLPPYSELVVLTG
jgi:PIN domain nuclease of toxin-antitoxin system